MSARLDKMMSAPLTMPPTLDVLKFEYLTQLLVDSSYVPLILKLLQLQEVEKVVNSKCEQEELK